MLFSLEIYCAVAWMAYFFCLWMGFKGQFSPSGWYSQWLNSAGTAFRHLCLAFHYLKLPFHNLKLSFHHLVMTFRHHFGKIIKNVATRGQYLVTLSLKIYFGWCFTPGTPDPARGDYSARSEPLAQLEGSLLLRGWEGGKGKEGERIEEGKGGKEGEEM